MRSMSHFPVVQMVNNICSENITSVAELLILGFQNLPELKPFLFLIFLTIYILTVSGNALIIVTLFANDHLHSPMYFFLGNLALLEMWYTSMIAPSMLGGLLIEGISISLSLCIAQFYFFGWLGTTECFLLMLMAYDRYVAICYPLHYTALMGQRFCLTVAMCAWAGGFMLASIIVYSLCNLQFYGRREIDHFFCDFMPLLRAACSDTSLAESIVFVLSSTATSIPCLLIFVSYAYIISAILRIPSATGRHKVFSTCSSHLIVVITYFGALIAMYVVPTTGQLLNLNKALSLLYTVATPMFNPIIYTLRNKDIREAVRKAVSRKAW